MTRTQRFDTLRARARALQTAELAHSALQADADGTTPVAGLQAVRVAGLAAATLDDGDGPALNLLQLCQLAEIIGTGCPSTALCLVMHWTSCLYMQPWMPELTRQEDRAHLAALCERVFEPIRTGQALIANCYGEPGSGAAIHRPFTSANFADQAWQVNGTKFGTMADAANFIQFHAQVLSSGPDNGQIVQFVVPRQTPGIAVETISDIVGVRGAGPRRVRLSDVVLEDRHRFGPVGIFDAAGQDYPFAALLLSAPYLGVAAAALDTIIAHLSHRSQQGASAVLADKDVLRSEIANLSVELEAARALLYRAAAEARPAPSQATRRLVEASKIAVARMVVAVTQRAMQLGGARMLMRHLPLERLMRDSHGAAVHPPSIPEALATIADTLLPAQHARAADTQAPGIVVSDDLPRAADTD